MRLDQWLPARLHIRIITRGAFFTPNIQAAVSQPQMVVENHWLKGVHVSETLEEGQ